MNKSSNVTAIYSIPMQSMQCNSSEHIVLYLFMCQKFSLKGQLFIAQWLSTPWPPQGLVTDTKWFSLTVVDMIRNGHAIHDFATGIKEKIALVTRPGDPLQAVSSWPEKPGWWRRRRLKHPATLSAHHPR